MKVLHLTLKKKWFDMILSGEKREEYREIKDYWCGRLIPDYSPVYGFDKRLTAFKDYDFIEFKNGYSKVSPTIQIEILGMSIGSPMAKWTDDDVLKDYFVIKLGKILYTKNIKP